MLTLMRRFLVVAALLYWQGGFLFYSANVVPIGTRVLGGKMEQGFITRHVARELNLAGAVALVPLFWDLLAVADTSRWRRDGRWLTWVVMLLTLGLLFWLYPQLDALLREEEGIKRVLERPTFHFLHRIYLWSISVQWGAAMLYAALSLAAWRAADRTVPPPRPEAVQDDEQTVKLP